MTINVKHEPRKEVIIHEMSKFDTAQELVDFTTKGVRGQINPMQWVDGVLMLFNAMPMTNDVSKEIMEGNLHWDYVAFAPLEEYQENMNNTSNEAIVPIQNVSNNETFQAIGQFLKSKF